MIYQSLEACLLDLERQGELLRIKEEVDPNLEMAAIHLRVHAMGGPALLFENVKGCRFRAASNIYGTLKRSEFIFRKTLPVIKRFVSLRQNPIKAIRHPLKNAGLIIPGWKAIPKKNTHPLNGFSPIEISNLPLIKHWPNDGGAFITLPQVYTEAPNGSGIMKANMGMYRIQLNGNSYENNKEIGLHYQIHRGIGVHQAMWNEKRVPMPVSVFVGGPPAHAVAAVMPLPEGMSEALFAGMLAGRRFRYGYHQGHCISADADFIVTGEVFPDENKPEGPFGDHLGYYSLTHPFPVMRVKQVWAKENAIWPFTVVGRPPQEDTSFGALIHEMTGEAIQQEMPGLKAVHAVDAAGVHPLLLAIGSERYTPYSPSAQPAEILTLANRILGTGQLSLSKFLFITAADNSQSLSVHDTRDFLIHILERFNPKRDLHFQTCTSIDTLDYSGTGLNTGSKLILAAYGPKLRDLATELPEVLKNTGKMIMPGVAAVKLNEWKDYPSTIKEMSEWSNNLSQSFDELAGVPLIIITDDVDFTVATLNNFLWIAFTRTNPSHDIFGVNAQTQFKHWGCNGPVIFDARKKSHHAPELILNPDMEKRVDALFEKGKSLYSLKNLS